MIRHWTEAGEEVYALYREKKNPKRYVVCQFDPHPTYHDAVTGEIVEYESNEEVQAVYDDDELPEDVRAGIVQYFDFPDKGGTGKPTQGS